MMKNVVLSLVLFSPLVIVANQEEAGTCESVFDGDFNTWLDSAFLSLDINKDGKLDHDENGDITGIVDLNSDGFIQLDEFQKFDSKTLFNIMDKNHDEYWNHIEVPQSLIELIENHDGFIENNDGKVDLVELSNYHATFISKNGQSSKSLTEMILLSVAGIIALIAAILMINHWRSSTANGNDKESQAFLGVEEYELDYPPEVAEFQSLRDSDETDEIKLKRFLMKRAVATVPMRLYIQTEEKNVQRLYQKSMISPTTWTNFQACLEEVKMEVEVIKEEAELLKEGWGETIISEAHWLHTNIENEKKQVDQINQQRREQQAAMMKNQSLQQKKGGENQGNDSNKTQEQEKKDREKAILELEQEAAREEAKKKKQAGGKKK